MQVSTQQPNNTTQPTAKILEVISSLIAPLGYEVVHFELQTHRANVLRLFIDRVTDGQGGIDRISDTANGIGVEDCAIVSRTLDEPLDQLPELDALFHGEAYELEVSSPGVDRPLRTRKDFARFQGRDVRVHTFRPLTTEETGNSPYTGKNPKQKNFLGRLSGLDGEGEASRVRLALSSDDGVSRARARDAAKKPGKKTPQTAAKREEIWIPLALISKANLEPDFDLAQMGLDGLED